MRRIGVLVTAVRLQKDLLRNAMPVTRRDREKALPDAWWRTRTWRT
jgi:hypothetical protein